MSRTFSPSIGQSPRQSACQSVSIVNKSISWLFFSKFLTPSESEEVCLSVSHPVRQLFSRLVSQSASWLVNQHSAFIKSLIDQLFKKIVRANDAPE